MARRRKRRSRSRSRAKQPVILLAGIAIAMLVGTLMLIVPNARRKHISTKYAVGLALLMWACSLFAIWACIRSRRRTYKHARVPHTSRTEDGYLEEGELDEPQAAPTGSDQEARGAS